MRPKSLYALALAHPAPPGRDRAFRANSPEPPPSPADFAEGVKLKKK
jgi:hypothetical protein